MVPVLSYSRVIATLVAFTGPRLRRAVWSGSAITRGSPSGAGDCRVEHWTIGRDVTQEPELRFRPGPIVVWEHESCSSEGTFIICDRHLPTDRWIEA